MPYFTRTLLMGSRIPILDRDKTPVLKQGDKIDTDTEEITLEKRLGAGGMGEVWKGVERYKAGPGQEDDVERDVAVKFVVGLDPDSRLTKRLVKEAQLIANVNHDNIVGFEGWGFYKPKKCYYIVMEYIEGMDVDGLMELHNHPINYPMHDMPKMLLDSRSMNAIPDKMAGFITFMVTNALEYAHNFRFKDGSAGVIHRDISPGNILVKLDEGAVKLSDFGIAATTTDLEDEGGLTVGKLPYMSPEAFTNPAMVDERSDIYSLGIVLYEMLTGIRPNDTYKRFGEDAAVNGMVGHLVELFNTDAGDRLVPPHKVAKGIDKRISDIVCKMLEMDPENRYGTVVSAEDHACSDQRCGAAAQTREAVRDFLYSHGVGPTKDSLRDYLRIRENPKDIPPEGMGNLTFLARHWLDSFPWVFRRFELTKYAKHMLEQGKNPARY